MLISVSHSMAIMLLQTHIIHWRILKNTHRKMFSLTTYIEQNSRNNHLALAKTNRVSVQKLCYS